MTNRDYYTNKEKNGMRDMKWIIPVFIVLALAIPHVSAAPTYFRQIQVTNEGSDTITVGSSAYVVVNTLNTSVLSQNQVSIWTNSTGNGSYVMIDRVNTTSYNNANTYIWFRVVAPIAAGSFDDGYQIRYGGSTPSIKGNWSNVFLSGGDGSFSGCEGNTTGTCGWTFYNQGLYFDIRDGALFVNGLPRNETAGVYSDYPLNATGNGFNNFKINFSISGYLPSGGPTGPRSGTCYGATSDVSADNCLTFNNGTAVFFRTDGGGTPAIDGLLRVDTTGDSVSGAGVLDSKNYTCSTVKYRDFLNFTCYESDASLSLGLEGLNLESTGGSAAGFSQGFVYAVMGYDDGFDTGPQFTRVDNVIVQKNDQNGPDPNGATGPETPMGGAPVDNPPTIVNNTASTNSTRAQSQILHNVQVQDDSALDSYIFSYKSGPSASFVNDTPVIISGMSFAINVSKHSGALNKLIQWRVYVSDNMGQESRSEVFQYTTTGDGAPTLTVNSPTNQTYTTLPISLNFSSSQAGSSFYYTLNGGSNISFTNPSDFSPANGNYIFRGFVNGTLGELSIATVRNFTVSVSSSGGSSSTGNLIYSSLSRGIGSSFVILAMILVALGGVYGKIKPKETLVVLLGLIIALALIG